MAGRRRSRGDNWQHCLWYAIRLSLVIKADLSFRFSVRGHRLFFNIAANAIDMLRMGSVNLVVIVESARSLIVKSNNELKPFHLPSILAVAVALGAF